MSAESPNPTPPPPVEQAPPPPKPDTEKQDQDLPAAAAPATAETVEKEEPPPPAAAEAAQHESKSLAAMMEKEEPSSPEVPPAAVKEETAEVEKTVATQEEVVVIEATTTAGKEEKKQVEVPKEKGPISMVSFKEESNIVADLSDSEKKALDELRQLVQEALNTNQFSSPPPPAAAAAAAKEGEKVSVTEQTPAVASDTPPKSEPPVSESDVSTELKPPQPQESTLKETPQEESKEAVKEEPKTTSLPEEVSIWGIPLLKDDRSDVILLKFLRARDFKVKDAFIMIKSTIRWRKQFKIDELVDEDLGDDLEKVVFMHGHDREGHPVCYNVYGEFQNKELYQKAFADEERRMKFLRWRIQFLERSIRKLDFSPGGINTIFQVNDLKNSPGPAKRELRLATRQALQLLQDNYPEFVAKQVFINVPWWYLAFYTMISPFMTQRTKSKIVFAGAPRSPETLFKYVSAEQVPIQYGGLSVDYCDCNPEFTVDDPATEITVKPGTKQTVEIIIYEKCVLVWELRVVGWEVSYGAEFVPDAKSAYTIIIQKPTKLSPTDEPVVSSSFKVAELGKILLTINNPTSKKKKLLYRFKINPFTD
ncbi:Patellin-3 [Turnera subulata]|uniref:Patellin-3 n=1 Tax=Turnera subulata TaxID=218843 RepID=A0A9Q0F2N0_9ROSI|nr:Patellin-3 [Turnera subulata]